MKMKFFLLLTVVLISITGFSQKNDSSIVKKIALLEQKRFTAQVDRNYDFLEKIFADDLVYIHSTGVMHNKHEYIQSIKDGKSFYKKIEQDKQDIRLYNKNTAVINGKIFIDFPTVRSHLVYTVVYVKKNKDWKVVSWQSLKLAD